MYALPGAPSYMAYPSDPSLPEEASPPAFPGGVNALMTYLARHIQYPGQARSNNLQGTVLLTFVVGKDGAISDINILRDIGGGCAEETMRVVAAMPRWTPGMVEGQPVKVRFTLPVRFKLDDPAPPKKKKKGGQRDPVYGN